jgi:hypothetical protein
MAYDAARTVIVFIDPIQQAVSTASHHSPDLGPRWVGTLDLTARTNGVYAVGGVARDGSQDDGETI